MALRNRKEHGGTSLVEFTLVGIPMIFLLVSTFEISRGMWTYHTLAYGVKEGTRYAAVHGLTCATAPNTCTVTVAQVAQQVQNATAGLLSSQMNLTFTSLGGTFTCTLANCLTNNAVWPAAPGNAIGSNIEIDATYPFQSAIAMFWPGAGTGVSTMGTINFPASSQDTMKN
jgi:Flp pilus assembly protein TadG